MSPKKVDSKPERPERVYKRAAKAQRDLFRKRRFGIFKAETLCFVNSLSDFQAFALLRPTEAHQ